VTDKPNKQGGTARLHHNISSYTTLPCFGKGKVRSELVIVSKMLILTADQNRAVI
jgi:hypothetical protein